MNVRLEYRGGQYQTDLDCGTSLAIALDFTGGQPGFFDVAPASARPLEADGFVGDTAQHGSCNVARLDLVPHCHGTHTESAAHLLDSHAAPPQPPPWMPARVISIHPQTRQACAEHYAGVGDETEAVISRSALNGFAIDAPALVVRTLPNPTAKLTHQYRGDNPHPYFTHEAIAWLVEQGVDHLLVDTPSIDRGHDDGSLSSHRIFWALDEARSPTDPDALERTITEFIYVPDSVADGLYLLNLQLPAWQTDAVPSRPVVFPIEAVAKP